MRTVLRKPHSSSKAASSSPGRPVIKLVRSTRSGMRARSFSNRSRRYCLSPRRFISFKTRSLQCWMGMSRYLSTLGSLAMTSMSSSVISSG